MKRKIISIFLSLALLCGLFPVGALTVSANNNNVIAYPVEGGNLYFDKETGIITDADTTITVANIPPQIDGVSVTGIGKYVFLDCSNLTNVTIPASVTDISDSAFTGCRGLSGIWVDEANEFYSNDAIGVLYNKDKSTIMKYPCGRNESYVIPSSVTAIGTNAFSYGHLTSVTIPNSVTTIGNFAFREAYSLSSVVIPESITSIGDYAFLECYFLDEIYFMGNAPSIGENAFETYCPGMKLYYIEGNEGWSSPTWNGYSTATWNPFVIAYPLEGGNIYFDKKTGTIIDSDLNITAANIPSQIDGVSVTGIGFEAFANRSKLTSVTIPAGVTEIGSSAFMFCSGLTSATLSGNIADSAFAFCSSLTTVTLLDGVTGIGDCAFDYCSALTSVTIPAGVTSIGDRAFTHCTALTAIWVDEANESYSSDACGVLFNKDKTTMVQCPAGYRGSYAIPDSVTSIEPRAFLECANMTGVTIPNKVTCIGIYTFEGCSSLTQVAIPAGVSEIHEAAFFNCNKLRAVYFMGDAPSASLFAFYAEDEETHTLRPIPGLTLYYIEGKEGWTSPTWNDYPTATWSGLFVDVPENAWYAEAVEYAVKNGLFNGMSATTFEPETSMTRAMLVTVLWRYAGETIEGANSFAAISGTPMR